jgi:hypothetical protein
LKPNKKLFSHSAENLRKIDEMKINLWKNENEKAFLGVAKIKLF